MSAFTDAMEARFVDVVPDFRGKFPDAPEWITIAREVEGVIICLFNASDDKKPASALVIKREDWQRALDLMPNEWISFPARTWEQVKQLEPESHETQSRMR